MHDSIETNYNLILDIRNESAVAALALHDWDRYQYNNRIYTQLFRELSADATLADYCRKMQQTRTNLTIAVVLLVLSWLALLPAYYFSTCVRDSTPVSGGAQQRGRLETLRTIMRRVDLELSNLHVSNAVLDNCLSALKHETMYYPSRIRQLIDQDDMESAAEVVDYYRELYNLLSGQAQDQVERVKLHLPPLDHGILGDEVLVRYLFDILKRMTGRRHLDVTSRP